MSWEIVFLTCFALGMVLSIFSAFTGLGHLHLGHLHFHTGPLHGHRGGSYAFNGFTVLAFLCWFGGIGYLLLRGHVFALPLILLCASLSGLVGAAAVFAFFVKVLMPHERALLPEDTEMRGVVARATSPIGVRHVGEIQFSLNGTRRSAVARPQEGESISRGEQVLVVRYEQGVAYVRPFTELEQLDLPHTPT